MRGTPTCRPAAASCSARTWSATAVSGSRPRPRTTASTAPVAPPPARTEEPGPPYGSLTRGRCGASPPYARLMGQRVLRVQSVLRRTTRSAPAPPETLEDSELVVDVTRRVARLGGVELALTVREFDLLVFLMRNPGRAFRRAELLEHVWGWTFGDQSTVTVHMRRLREKVEEDPADPRRILTVWGVGYRYEPAAAHG